jgi:hypothetical protein
MTSFQEGSKARRWRAKDWKTYAKAYDQGAFKV